MPAVAYRASVHVVAYWQDGRLVLHQYAAGIQAAVDPVVLQILHACRDWRRLGGIVNDVGGVPADVVRAAVDRLVAASFLLRSDRQPPAAEAAYRTWDTWNPAAAFFHAATRDVEWAAPHEREVLMRQLTVKARTAPVPPALKPARRRSLALAPARSEGEFPAVLLARRTWRTFSRRAVSFEALSTLLGLTAGVQRWGMSGAGRVRVPFTTSPSAGAKHPLELYVVARRVSGLRPGVYHYLADDHRLEHVAGPVSPRQLEQFLGRQWYFRDAGAVVFMTAVWERTRWTYTHPRAYRSVWAEAGHVCQTFCLVATWLDLAPFCTMALADARIEALLGIDGITEGVIYAAGVGTKPPGGRWVQWPDHEPGHPAFQKRRPAIRKR